MILEIYAFQDKKAQELINPVFMKNEQVLRRELSNMLKEKPKNIPFVEFPADFDVYKVGEFDTNAVNNNSEKVFKPNYILNVADILNNKSEEL